MDEKLREELSNMSDEDFFEVMRNMEISRDLRDLMRGEEPFTEGEIMKRLDITALDLLYVFNGAFEFTTRHMAVIDVLKEEYEWLNSDASVTKEEEQDKADEEYANEQLSDVLDYGIFGDRGDYADGEVIEIGESRNLTAAELAEIENDDRADLANNASKTETMEELSKRINREYLEKMQQEGEKQQEKNTDPSIVTFD